MTSYVGPEVKRHVKTLARLSRKSVNGLDDREKLHYLAEVDAALVPLFNESLDFKRMYRPENHMETPELLEVLLLTERLRFEDIPKIGYLPLYDKFDRKRYQKNFESKTGIKDSVAGFHIGAGFITEAMNGLDTGDVPNSVMNLYIKLRELEPTKPTRPSQYRQHAILSDLYQSRRIGEETAPHYLSRLAETQKILEEAAREYGITHYPFSDLPPVDVEVWRLYETLVEYTDVLRRLYGHLIFARIRKVV